MATADKGKKRNSGNKKSFELLEARMEAIRNSPEQALMHELDSMKWSFKIVHGNYSDLMRPVELLEEKPEAIKLWAVENREELHRMYEEIGRLLFNFLAAVMMLVDHTRRRVRKLYTEAKYSEFRREYDEETGKRFKDSANHQLAQGLRNYIQHRNLPAIGSLITWDRDSDLKKMFRISTESLLEWNEWKPLARAKLKSLGEHFPLRQFVEDYFKEVEAFQKWLRNRQVDLHKEDVERLNKMKAEAREAFKKAGFLTDNELNKLN